MLYQRLLIIILFLITGVSHAQSPSAVYDSIRNTKLIVGVKHTPPFIIKTADGKYEGISIKLWEHIARELRLDYEYQEYDLNGLLTSLMDKKIDVCINPLTVTSQRVEKIDFTQPFFITNLAIAVGEHHQNKWIVLIKNFFSLGFFKAILLLFAVLMLFGVLVWLFERNKNKEEFGPGMKGVWNGLWWSAVTMTTVGYGDKSPKTTGGRIVALIWMFTAIIIISGFTASIASSLTVNELESSVNGPEDLNKVNTLVVKASTGEQYLQANNIDYQQADDIETALRKLADSKVYAVVYDEPIMKYTIRNLELSSKVVVMPSKFATQYYGFSLPKDSPMRSMINPILLERINSKEWGYILSEYDLEK